MAKEATARARMDAALKDEAEGILAECGLNATQGINLFYRQVVLQRGRPGPDPLTPQMDAEAFAMARRKQHTAHELGHAIGMPHNHSAAAQGIITAAREDLYEAVLRVGSGTTERYVDAPIVPTPAGADTAGQAAVRAVLQGLGRTQRQTVYDVALQQARNARTFVEDTQRTIEWEAQRADRYRVEIHKKYSIAVACVIFVLIGAPLGLSARRGGLGVVGAMATVIFLFYWVTLVQGEKFADRGFLPPWLGMWISNIVFFAFGLWLLRRTARETAARCPHGSHRRWSSRSTPPWWRAATSSRSAIAESLASWLRWSPAPSRPNWKRRK